MPSRPAAFGGRPPPIAPVVDDEDSEDQPTQITASPFDEMSTANASPAAHAAKPMASQKPPAPAPLRPPARPGSDAPPPLRPGDELPSGTVVAARYTVEKLLGHGGMGAVYSVKHVNTGEMLALKMLHPSLASNAQAVERFRAEARAPVRIQSEHVVRVVDADVAPELGVPFLVMELLRGRDLGTELKRRGALPAGEVVLYLRQVARALDRAHAIGIVHRDLKPANLYLTSREDGTPLVKILDYGIAKLTDASASNELTQAGSIFGTPWYMSPEQARGEVTKVGPPADIWSLGLIAFRLLTGKNYWSAEGMAALIGQICYEPLTPPSRIAPHVGPRFDAWFARACNRESAQRFPSAGNAIEELGIALGVQGGQHGVSQPEISYFPVGHPAATPSGPISISHAPMNMTPMTPMTASPMNITPMPGAGATDPLRGPSTSPPNAFGPSAPTPPRPMMPSAPSMSQPGFAMAPAPYSSSPKKQLSTGAALAAGLGIALAIAAGAGGLWFFFGRPGMHTPESATGVQAAAADGTATASAAPTAEPSATAEASAAPAATPSAEPAPSAEASDEPEAAEAPSAAPSAAPSVTAEATAPAAPSAAPQATAASATGGAHPAGPTGARDATPAGPKTAATNAPKVGKIKF